MGFLSKIGRLLTVDDSILDEEFSLLPPGETDVYTPDERSGKSQSEKQGTNRQKNGQHGEDGLQRQQAQEEQQTQNQIPYYEISGQEAQSDSSKADNNRDQIPTKVSNQLEENRQVIKSIFQVPTNKDVVIRELFMAFETPVKAFAVYMQGVADGKLIKTNVLEPLMIWASVPPATTPVDFLKTIQNKVLTGNQVQEEDKWDKLKNAILGGSTALFLEGCDKALIIATTGWKSRSVGETKTETVVRGPHEAFTENLVVNIGLVRTRLRTERLVTEKMQVGKLAPTDIAIMYVSGIVNPRLVKEVKRRIKTIKVDFLQDSGQLEEFLEDPPRRTFMPKMMATERPDRVAASLTEGFVVVFVGQSPYALILPTTLWSLLQTAEDYYIRYPFGSFIRTIRFTSLVIALLLPSFYIAVTNFHPEMIPTDLMLTIAAAREQVPFPVVMEVLLMELALELIREAGIRIPNVIGPTIGIVGALILGQAAVQAGIISPLLVIIVAVTALASFTLPNYNLAFAVRMLRFVYILLASTWGFYGIALGVMVLLMQWATMKSLGVPMLSPVSPSRPSSPDVIFRGAQFDHEIRPRFLRPQDGVRQKKFTRSWDPRVHDSKEARRQSDQGGKKHD